MRFFLLAILFGFGCARADPALWVVRQGDATIYLFGTMHVLPRQAAWFTPAIREAFGRSEVLWEEADVGIGDPAKMMSIMQEAVSPTDLFALLPSNYASTLRRELAACGLPDIAVAHLKPWMASMMPDLCALMKQGEGAGAGRDMVAAGPEATLLKAAQNQGKPVAFFETAADQIGYLSAGTQQAQIVRLEHAIDEASGANAAEFLRLETAWLTGNEPDIAHEIARLRQDDPEQYRVLYAERNRRFAARVAEMARGHGTFFVAVGAAHLAGPDSVQAFLRAMGVTAVRL